MIADGYRVDRLALPVQVAARRDLHPTVCGPGLVAVPFRGGLVLAGWKGWLIAANTVAGDAVACAGDAGIALLRAGALLRKRGAEAPVKLAEVPAGDYQLTSAGDAIWVHGRQGKAGALYRWSTTTGLQPIWRGNQPILAAAAAGNALVTCIDRQVLLWRPGAPPRRLGRFARPCDGVAIDGRGQVYVSIGRGLLKLRGDRPPEVVAIGMHGPLVAQGSRVYVLWREQGAIYAIAPLPLRKQTAAD
jgi:hypothetical protein